MAEKLINKGLVSGGARASLETIRQEMGYGIKGKKVPDQSKMGEALLNLSSYLVNGIGDAEAVERLRQQWREQEGPRERADASVKIFQTAIREISMLKEPFDSHVFYVPGSSGYVRLCLGVSSEGEPIIDLVDSGSFREIEERFEKVKGQVK